MIDDAGKEDSRQICPVKPAVAAAGDLDCARQNPAANGSTLCWSITAILLSFLCFTHLGILLLFSAGWRPSPWVAPAALLFSLAAGDWLAQRERPRGPLLRIAPPAIALAVVALALFLAASFLDMGWDALWYHQTAVYQMYHGWNPIRDPMHSFIPRNVEPMLRHYSKEPWYVALALFETTRNIEAAKAGTWMALAAMFFAVFAAALDFGMPRRTALVIAALVSLNPVVVCESASYLVDGLMVSFLTCFVAALFRWFRQPTLLVLVVLMASAVLCINAKLTGLVYLCFACAAGGAYTLIKRRRRLERYAAIQTAAVLLGVVVFGFNPYVTNTVHRGNPFYPLLGTAVNPGMNSAEQDPIDRYETPTNMVGHNRIVRLGYALFSRPGAQPVAGGDDARLMWPFDAGWKDFNMFRIHGVRISGFGPLFSGAFLISLVLLGAVLAPPGRFQRNSPRCGETFHEPRGAGWQPAVPPTASRRYGRLPVCATSSRFMVREQFNKEQATPDEPALVRRSGPEAARGDARPTQSGMPREVLLLFACTIVASLLISRHTWWARLGPQLWWLPILAVIAGLSVPDLRTARWTACGLAALLLVNATLVAFAHFRWEIEATRTLRGQMAFLRQQGEIEVDFQYFREPFGERLRAAGVTFHAVRSLSCESPMELMSVAPGYPGSVRVCVHKQ